MKRFSSILLVFCAALLVFPIAACEKKETADVEDVPPGTIAMVGPETITVDEMSDAFRKQADFLGVENITPEMKQDLLTRRIERMLAWLYARDQGMQVPPEKFEERTADMSKAEIQERLDGINEQLLIEQVWQGVLNGVAVTQEEIEEYYQGNKDDFRVPDLYRVYLVKVTEERADHVLQMSRKDPSSFDDMALKTLTDEVLKRINQNAVLSPKGCVPRLHGAASGADEGGRHRGTCGNAPGNIPFQAGRPGARTAHVAAGGHPGHRADTSETEEGSDIEGLVYAAEGEIPRKGVCGRPRPHRQGAIAPA